MADGSMHEENMKRRMEWASTYSGDDGQSLGE
jgi:hypothetical protein